MKKKWKEPDSSLEIWRKHFKIPMRSSIYGEQCGTPKSLCAQFGVSFRRGRNIVKISGPRDRMQKLADKLHICRVPFRIVSKKR
jgi:ribosomal protein S14